MSILPISSRSVPTSCPDVVLFPHDAKSCTIATTPDQLAWLNDDASNDLIDGYPGPSWDAPSYIPTPHAEAQEAGYRRGYALDWAARPACSLDSLTRLCWLLGKLEGTMHRRADDAERADYERDLEEWSARPEVRDPSETIRAVGCIAARSEGGVR